MRLAEDERGQTVSEYSLLLAFIFLVFVCLFVSTASDITSIWEATNRVITMGAPTVQSGKH
jgi:Flp pilus assembly pilin Flp